ncbi:MAG TPA: acyl carrier protein [Sumerlaeia bacterium]|nr:acyl carrier protein [Sumerlaeia bacterium]
MIHDELQAILREVFGDENLEMTDDMTAEDVEKWDSLSHINMIVAAEEHFGVRFKNSQIARLQCVGDLKDLIMKKRPDLD